MLSFVEWLRKLTTPKNTDKNTLEKIRLFESFAEMNGFDTQSRDMWGLWQTKILNLGRQIRDNT